MTDKFSIISFKQLTEIIFNQFNSKNQIFGIPKELFFIPDISDPFCSERFGQLLETPVGVAAGPHTQLAQNIIAAWLTGARFIELKTIQTLDELEISKPCIDMQDEGYNCEWSQELKIRESFDQYLNAWILIHILKDKFGWKQNEEIGAIFNMSVGYNLQGILKDNVQWFFSKMQDCSAEKTKKIEQIRDIYPNVANLKIPDCISNNVTLSTMHGCPPNEIEKIGKYLLQEKKLHTSIKLNPTLLGKKELQNIIYNSGFETQIPDIAFDHDLKFDDAVKIINNLKKTAIQNKLHFGLKLTNTLESKNHKSVFPSNEEMMYMSGRALHPISINLAGKLQNEFNGELDISFSGGTDAFNITNVLACGLAPATVCSDLLKPGGYTRIYQYIENLREEFKKQSIQNLDDFIYSKSRNKKLSLRKAALENLNIYADNSIQDSTYRKTSFVEPSIKTNRPLGNFDCIHAPCTDTCPTNQDIPDYLYYTAQGDFKRAYEVIVRTNPFPSVTGMICDHACQLKCIRINYDSPLLIREVKRFIAQNSEDSLQHPANLKPTKAAIIGAGLSGLSCGYFLALAGFDVNIYESKDKPGGMAACAIPSFRLTDEAFNNDLKRIEEAGVKINYNTSIDKKRFEKLKSENQYLYIAAGAQSVRKLHIAGCEADGVLDPLEFLFELKKGKSINLGKNIAVIGGGNTAMDVARTALRVSGEGGKVTIIYRRSIKEMPADQDEIKAVLDEGIKIVELVDPVKINTKNNKVVFLTLIKMRLEGKDSSGRPKPVKIINSEFDINFDTVIPAIGQDQDFDFFDENIIQSKNDKYQIVFENVFVGGDALRGASTAINAIGDGRKTAEKIINKANVDFNIALPDNRKEKSLTEHLINRAQRIFPVRVNETSISERNNFSLITETLTKSKAIEESSRCLACDELCNICTSVCPNLAFHSYQIVPVRYNLQKIIIENNNYKIAEDRIFEISQKYQILHIADWCNECGNCTTFCPSSGSPYKDKPHLYLNKESFNKDSDGCYLEKTDNKLILLNKEEGQLSSLLLDEKHYICETEEFDIKLEKDTFRVIDINVKRKYAKEISLQKAAEMSIILQGAESFIL